MKKEKLIQKSVSIVLTVVFFITPVASVFANTVDSVSTASDLVVTPASEPDSPVLNAPLPDSTAATTPTVTPDSALDPITLDSPSIASDGNAAPASDANAPAGGKTKKGDTSELQAQSSSASSGSGTDNQAKDSSVNRISVNIDELSGALNYSYAFSVPPGRNGMAPSLSLNYNSEDKNNVSEVGFGWSLSLMKIERINKKGTDALYTSNDFKSSLSGELKQISGNSYGAKIEDGSFLNYQFTNNVWTVTAKDGTVYTFGDVASARLADPNDASKIHTWYITKIQDTNGNFMAFSYYKDAANNAVYPELITYTNNGANFGPYTISFLREDRPDANGSYAAGFLNKITQRINEVRIETDNSWTRKYILNYVAGDNGVRSMLQSITEIGRDEAGVTTTLPNFSVLYSQPNNTITNNSTISYPLPNGQHFSFSDVYIRIMDVNGDGLKDIVKSWYAFRVDGLQTIFWVLKNNGHGWDVDTSWAQPQYSFTDSRGNTYQNKFDFNGQVIVADWNGDGKDDLIRFWREGSSGQEVQHAVVMINAGNTWQQDNSVIVDNVQNAPIISGSPSGTFTDLNGDGLVDYIYARSYQFNGVSYPEFAVWYNQDGNLVFDNSVSIPWTNSSMGNNPLNLSSGVKVLDINNDGLVDFLMSSVGVNNFWVLLNTGHGWVQDTTILQPNVTYTDSGGGQQITYLNTTVSGWVPLDINGDRLPDFIGLWNYGAKAVLINNGHGWTQDNSVISVGQYSSSDGSTGYPSTDSATTLFFDMNGDGLDDIINCNFVPSGPNTYSGVNWTLTNTGSQANLLNGATLPEGGSYTFAYKTTANYSDGSGNSLNTQLPFIYNTVSSITTNDGLGQTATTTYEYADGSFYYKDMYDRKIAGFGKVTVTDPASNKVINYYHLGNGLQTGETDIDPVDGSLIGKVYSKSLYNPSSILMSQSYINWASVDLGNQRNFVYASRNITNEDSKQVANEFSYNTSNGNLISQIDYGKVSASTNTFSDAGSDKRITNFTYTAGPIQVSLVEMLDQSSQRIKQQKFYYDNQVFGVASLGNQTKVDSWVSGANYNTSQKTYTPEGLVATQTDPRGNVTTYNYDAYNLYPATITNALSQNNYFLYNYGVGKAKQVTDANGFKYQTTYDGLGRTTQEKIPGATAASSLLTKADYIYTDTPNNTSVQKIHYLDGSTSVQSFVYMDGFGRVIQERNAMEGGIYSVKDRVYNNLGLVSKESLAYASSGSAKTSPTSTNALYVSYVYDGLKRVKSTANAIGTANSTYNGWQKTETDVNNTPKDYFFDAFGSLVQVSEHDGSSTYITTYDYNGADTLIKITDALGNIRNFTYDGLGNRLTAQDLHSSTDTTFGTWTYVYDNAGNLLSTTDPKNQVVNYAYDALNRMLSQNYTGAAGVEVSNTYDVCQNGIGKLCSVVSAGATDNYSYDSLGNISSQSRTIASTNYVTGYTYNRQSNVLVTTNPDGSQFQNVYNAAGLIDQVQRKETTNTSFFGAVNNFDYSPEGKVVTQSDYNGTTTINTYDTNKLYRLTSKVTTDPSGVRIQDLTYTYDNVGNITEMVDASATANAKTANYTYDNLYRLTSATITGVASGQQNYSQTFTYDALGNILTKTETIGTNPAATYTYAYAGNTGTNYANPHAVTSISNGANTTTYGYDNNGNLASSTVGGAGPAWYSTGGTWTTRKQLTIDHTKVSGTANLTNFPVLVSVTDATLKTVANGGNVGKSDGSDILFTLSDGVTKLSHEIEKYNSATGALTAWFKIPTLTYATDTVLIIYYGNASASNQQNKVNVWDSNTKAVWHFAETSGNFNDSTSNANTGVATSVSRVTGKIGGGASFNGTSSTINAGTGSSLNVIGNTLTIEAWVSRASTSSLATLIRRGTSGSNGYTVALGVSSCTSSQFKLSKFGVVDICLAGLPNNTSVHHLAMVWSSTGVKAYVDGALTGTSTNTQNFISSTSPFYIGLNTKPFFSGTVDEMKVSNNARSADWIKTEYNNQNSPSTFMALGSVAGGGVTTTNVWDYNNKLTQVATGSVTVTYAYDASGQRVKYGNGTTTTYYPTKSYNIDNVTPTPNITKHIFANGADIATIQGTGANAQKYYTATDLLNSSSIITDSTGAVVETLDYFPFGVIRIDQKATPGPLAFSEQRKYIGQEYDADTGLAYLNARYYNATLAKFVSEDPVFLLMGDDNQLKQVTGQEAQQYLTDPQQFNSYGYANNNPILRSDPSGQLSTTPPQVEALQKAILGMQKWLGNYIAQNSQNFNASEFQAKNREAMKNGNIYLGTTAKGNDLQFGVLGVVGSLENVAATGLQKLASNVLVCRGGLCNAKSFIEGKGVKIDEFGKLQGVSVNASNTTISELTKGIPHSKYGQTTVGEIRKLGGDVVRDVQNGFHAILKGITPEQAEKLFNPVKNNLFKK